MSGGGPAGFYRAPVSKATCIITGSISAARLLWQPSPKVLLLLSKLGSVPAAIVRSISFGSAAELVVALYLLYTFRQFERYMGSNRFSMMLTFIFAFSRTLSYTWGLMLGTPIAGGLYSIIFGLFILYHRHIPKLRPRVVTFLGIDISDKSLVYLVGLQLALNSGMGSFIPAFSGTISAIAFLSDSLPFSKLKWPSSVSRLCSGIFLPLFASTPPGHAQRQRAAAQQQADAQTAQQRQQMAAMMAAMGGALRGRGAAAGAPDGQQVPPEMAQALNNSFSDYTPVRPVPPPSDEVVASIVGMGFEHDAVVEALRATQNNEQMAVNRLLSGS